MLPRNCRFKIVVYLEYHTEEFVYLGTASLIQTSNLLTYLFTELSPSWGAVNCAAPQEPPSILWNPKVQYRVYKSPPLVPLLSHINPIHSIPSYLSKIDFNIVPSKCSVIDVNLYFYLHIFLVESPYSLKQNSNSFTFNDTGFRIGK
jgi:hypothetical protein